MSRETPCGRAEARRRALMARTYLDVADQATLRESEERRNVAAGNAVLAAIAAADALCCLRLGRHARGQAHEEATALLRTIRPDGPVLAKDLATVLGVKDAAHYGTVFVSSTVLRSTLRATTRLVIDAPANQTRQAARANRPYRTLEQLVFPTNDPET